MVGNEGVGLKVAAKEKAEVFLLGVDKKNQIP